jgi:transposase-like protein
MMTCPYCQSSKVVKNGHRQGRQSYLCRDCHRRDRDSPDLGHRPKVKALCVEMSLNGIGFCGIERVTGINHNSVINWVRQAEAAILDENHELPETAQLDELQIFVGAKKQSLALDGREHKTIGDSQVCRGRSFARDVPDAVADDSRLGVFSLHHRWLQGLSLFDRRRRPSGEQDRHDPS